MLRLSGLFSLAALLAAQTSLSIREAIDLAVTSHPLLAASTERIAVSEGLSRQAGLRHNPSGIFQTENWPPYASRDFQPGRDQDTFLYLSQLFETAGKRERRVDLAQAGVLRSRIERDLAARQIGARVKNAYWAAAASQKIAELLGDSQRTFQEIIDYHEFRVKEGAMAEADLLKVRLEGERIRIALNTAQLDAQRARIGLYREMGQTEFPAVRLSDAVDSPVAPPEPRVETALALRPELGVARQAVAQARANVSLQRAGGQPDVNVSFGYKRSAGRNTLMGIVEVPLPFVNRNQGNIEAGVAEVRLAESQLAAAEAVIRAEVASAAADTEVRRRLISETFPGLLERATESSRIAVAAYREGGTDLLRVLDAERVRNEIQVLYYSTLGEYRQSVSALESALGMEP